MSFTKKSLIIIFLYAVNIKKKMLYATEAFVSVAFLCCATMRNGASRSPLPTKYYWGFIIFGREGLAPAVKLNSRHYKKIHEQSIVRGFLLVHFYFLSSLSSQTAPKSRALNKPFFSELLTTLSLGFFSWSVLMI